MDLFTTYIQRNDNQHLADNLLEPCKKILSEIPNDNRYEFGKTSFYYSDIWEKYKDNFKDLYDYIFSNAFAYCEKMELSQIEKVSIENIWGFPAKKGNILIWKSDLPHSVDLNMSSSRIAISFNLRLITDDGKNSAAG